MLGSPSLQTIISAIRWRYCHSSCAYLIGCLFRPPENIQTTITTPNARHDRSWFGKNAISTHHRGLCGASYGRPWVDRPKRKGGEVCRDVSERYTCRSEVSMVFGLPNIAGTKAGATHQPVNCFQPICSGWERGHALGMSSCFLPTPHWLRQHESIRHFFSYNVSNSLLSAQQFIPLTSCIDVFMFFSSS